VLPGWLAGRLTGCSALLAYQLIYASQTKIHNTSPPLQTHPIFTHPFVPDMNLQVGSVIRNPEIAKLVPMLLAAIADPAANNKHALDTLLATVFVNTVDAPSLALLIPVVHRSLRDRSGGWCLLACMLACTRLCGTVRAAPPALQLGMQCPVFSLLFTTLHLSLLPRFLTCLPHPASVSFPLLSLLHLQVT
jgi:hypothetical protein